MHDDTRRLLKVFGVAVTDAEAEAERLDARLAAAGGADDLARLLKDASDLCRELNARWLDVTQRVFAVQTRLQEQLAQAAAALRSAGGKS